MKVFKGIKDSFPQSHLSVIKEIESVVDNVPAGG